MTLSRLRALLADRYGLDAELRAAIAEQGRTPHLLERVQINRADILGLREEIDVLENGARVYGEMRVVTGVAA